MLYIRFGIVKCVRNSSIPIDWIGFRCVSSFRLLLFSNWAEVWDIVMRASGNQSSWIVKNRKKISSFLILVLSLLLECDVFFSCFLRDACLVCVHSFEVFFFFFFRLKAKRHMMWWYRSSLSSIHFLCIFKNQSMWVLAAGDATIKSATAATDTDGLFMQCVYAMKCKHLELCRWRGKCWKNGTKLRETDRQNRIENLVCICVHFSARCLFRSCVHFPSISKHMHFATPLFVLFLC